EPLLDWFHLARLPSKPTRIPTRRSSPKIEMVNGELCFSRTPPLSSTAALPSLRKCSGNSSPSQSPDNARTSDVRLDVDSGLLALFCGDRCGSAGEWVRAPSGLRRG